MITNILLINPKHSYRLGAPPLGIGYILSYARAMSQNNVIFLDENFVSNPDNDIFSIITENNIGFVGVSFASSAITRVLRICQFVREHFGNSIVLFAGGYHPTSEPEKTLQLMPDFDFIVTGEGEQVISALGEGWKSLPNVAYIENGRFIQNPLLYIEQIDTIPFPQRSDFDNRYYLPSFGTIAGIYGRVATIMSSRGCPYSCNFCSSKAIQKKVRYHSTNYVMDEIEHILGRVGEIDYLYFLDVMFLTNWGRVEELCRSFIHARLPRRFRWAATVASNVVNDEKIRLMKEAGCFYLSFGFESNSQRVLSIINKKATPEHNRTACDLCRKQGLYVNSAFLFGIPGETTEDLKETIRFVKKNAVHFTGVNIMKPLPGSPFYYDFVQKSIINPSLEEWHEISSIHVKGRIFNDLVSSENYKRYIRKFDRAVYIQSKIAFVKANWRKTIKYFIKRNLSFIPDTTYFEELSPDEYKAQTKINWTTAPCGSSYSGKELMTKEFYEEVEHHRYSTHPWILENIGRFDLKGKKLLEIGYGMGTDHLSLARQGAELFGLDLTPKNLEITRRRLHLFGFDSQLAVGDAERLPYNDQSFDFVYSFGVIHHSPDTQKIISEIYRILKPGGRCWITVYHRNSIFFWWSLFIYDWIIKGGRKRETLKQRISRIEYPNINPNLVIRLFGRKEIERMFYRFSKVKTTVNHLIRDDIALFGKYLPEALLKLLSRISGWYIIVDARK